MSPSHSNDMPKKRKANQKIVQKASLDEELLEDDSILRLEDENRRLKSGLKDLQRETTLFKSLAKVIRTQSPFSTFAPYKQKSIKSKIKESALLILSDSHADQEILGKRVQGLEEYNFDVACKRAERIVDTTISHLKDNMRNYNFERLYIAGLGDYVNGEIHAAIAHSKWHNSIKNAMGMGELFSMMITDLSRHFPEIVFCSVSGNHGRRSIKKNYRGAHDNWDYMVAIHTATRLQKLIADGRLKVILPDSWSMGLSIYDWNFLLSHGDDIKSFNSIPYYGIERKTRRLNALGSVLGVTPHYFLFGHFHTLSSQQHTTGETIINGSWNATDEYALEKLGAFGEPYQWLMGVHPKYGLTWRMPIQLRAPAWKKEEQSIGRYSVNIFEEFEDLSGFGL